MFSVLRIVFCFYLAYKMVDPYSRNVLKIVVAQICQTIGWHAIQSTPLELLTDVFQKYIHELGRTAHRYGEQCKFCVYFNCQ